MSLSTLRKNFYRIATLIIDYGAEAMRCLLDQFIQKKYKVSFQDFVTKHQHEIYHQFNNTVCCQCTNKSYLQFSRVISVWQMEKLFDKHGQKLSGHSYNSKCEFCCSTVMHTLQIHDIDITLLRFFLVTYFEDEFWQNCCTKGSLFRDFLNHNKHDIFHLLQLKTPCCLCQARPGYMVMMVAEKDRLNKTQWETMFHITQTSCTQHINCTPKTSIINPCSVLANTKICYTDLDSRVRTILLSKFCTIRKHIDQLVNARNTVFAHAVKGELSDDDFRQLWNTLECSIVYLSKITNTDQSRTRKILELREKPIDESLNLETQCLILRQMQDDEHILQVKKTNDYLKYRYKAF